jgi:hypothetical protein
VGRVAAAHFRYRGAYRANPPYPPFSKGDVAAYSILFLKGEVVLAIVEAAPALAPLDNAAFPPLKKGGRGDFIRLFSQRNSLELLIRI